MEKVVTMFTKDLPISEVVLLSKLIELDGLTVSSFTYSSIKPSSVQGQALSLGHNPEAGYEY